jgi:hypothetical protein
MRSVASNPSSTGMLMSMRTTCGRSSPARRRASSPSAALPTTSIPASPVRTASSAAAKRPLSSAMRTVTRG